MVIKVAAGVIIGLVVCWFALTAYNEAAFRQDCRAMRGQIIQVGTLLKCV